MTKAQEVELVSLVEQLAIEVNYLTSVVRNMPTYDPISDRQIHTRIMCQAAAKLVNQVVSDER